MPTLFMTYLLLAVCLLLSACGNSVKCVPESDPSKWVEYTTRIDNFMLSYKYPGSDGKPEFEHYRPLIDTITLDKNQSKVFVFGFYDNKTFPRFDLKIYISNYTKKHEIPPGIDDFTQDCVNHFNNKGINVTETYNHIITEINGIKYLNVVFYNSNGRVESEVYHTPLTPRYYLTIAASYDDEFAKDPDWLSSRRKIFKEFAENVVIRERQ